MRTTTHQSGQAPVQSGGSEAARRWLHEAPCFVAENRDARRIELRAYAILQGILKELPPTAKVVDKYYGGSMVPYAVDSRYRKAKPGDLDPLFFVASNKDAWTDKDWADLEKTFREAANKVLREMTGRNVTCKTQFEYDAQGERMLSVRIGWEHHIDLRVLPQGSRFLAADTHSNALLLPMDDVDNFSKRLHPKAPPGSGLSANAGVRDWERGISRMVQDLTRDSIRRAWKERALGKVPATLEHESKLLDTLFAHFRKEQADTIKLNFMDNVGTVVRHNDFMQRVRNDVAPEKRVGLFANAIVQVQQYPDSEDKHTLLALLRKQLTIECAAQPPDSRLDEAALASRRAILAFLQSDAGVEKLNLWLHMVAEQRLPVLDQTNLPAELDVARVEVEETPWLRAYDPGLGTHLILPDKPAVRALPQTLRDSTDIAELLAENHQERANFVALTPPGTWDSPARRKAAALRAFTLSNQAGSDARQARGQLLRTVALLDPERNTIAALQDVATGLGEAGAPFKAMAQQQRERFFGTALNKLCQNANNRDDAWRTCKRTVNSSDDVTKRALSEQIIAALPALLAKLDVHKEHDEVLPLLKGVTGVLSRDAAVACHLLKATLAGSKRKFPTLSQALDSLLKKYAKAAPQDDASAGAALTTLVERAQWDEAWSHLKLQRDAVKHIEGATAARLLEAVDAQLLAQDPAITLALLERVAHTDTPLRTFWDDAERLDRVLNEPTARAFVQRLIDTTPTPEPVLRRWLNAMKAQPALLKQAAADTAASSVTFLPVAELMLDPRLKQLPDDKARLVFMNDTWLRYREPPQFDRDKAANFVADGLAHLNATTVDAALVDMPVVNQWWEAVRRGGTTSLAACAPTLTTLALGNNAHETAAKMLMEWSLSLAKDRPTRQRFADLASSLMDGLLADRRWPVRNLVLAQKIALLVPDAHWEEEGPWPTLIAQAFMGLVARGRGADAETLRARMHKVLRSPVAAEHAVADIYRAGTPEERGVWLGYALETVARQDADLNAVRLAEKMALPTIDELRTLDALPNRLQTIDSFFTFVALRHRHKPVSSGEVLGERLEFALRQSHIAGAVKTYVERQLAVLPAPGAAGAGQRYGLMSLIRAYVQTSASDAERHGRLQDAYRWIEQEPLGNLAATTDAERQAAVCKLQMLTPIASDIFKDDPENALAKFQWLFERLVQVPDALGMMEEVLAAAKSHVPDPSQAALDIINGMTQRATSEGRFAGAFKVASRGLYFAQEALLSSHPDSVVEFADWVLDHLVGYRRNEKAVLIEQVHELVETLQSMPNVSTKELGEFIPILRMSLGRPIDHSEHQDHAWVWLHQEFVGALVHQLLSPTEAIFRKGVRTLLRADKHIVHLPLGQRERIVAALKPVMFERRAALQEEMLTWNLETQKQASLGSQVALKIALDAVCSVVPLDGGDLLNYLYVLCSRGVDDALVQKAVNAAKAGCLHGAQWKNDARFSYVMPKISDALRKPLKGLTK